jgi:hypothetical protein
MGLNFYASLPRVSLVPVRRLPAYGRRGDAGLLSARARRSRGDGAAVENDQIVRIFKIAGWAVGGIIALLSLILIFVLNGIRRLCKIRRVTVLHPVIVLLGTLPWLWFGVQLVAFEPRHTPFARAAIDFVGAPMLWGALAASVFALLGFLLLLIPARKA